MWRCKECGGQIKAFVHVSMEFDIDKNKEVIKKIHQQPIDNTKYTCMCGLVNPSYKVEDIAEWIEETEAEKECREKFEKGAMRFFDK